MAAVQRTAEQQAAQKVTVAEARRSYEIAQARYRIGLTDLLTVLNIENALFVAENALVQVRQAHLQALVSLFNALGGGWQLNGNLHTKDAVYSTADRRWESTSCRRCSCLMTHRERPQVIDLARTVGPSSVRLSNCIVPLLKGGGALGAYPAGVYEALAEAANPMPS